MKEEIREFASRLAPPPHDADPDKVQAWRWFLALTTGVNTMGLAIHVLLSCGYATALGISGFAKAGDVAGIRQEMAEVKIDLRAKRVRELSSLMLDAKQKQCAATGQAKRLYLQSYNEMRTEYFQIMGREFPDPPCADFG
jgi:hypothetical protein